MVSRLHSGQDTQSLSLFGKRCCVCDLGLPGDAATAETDSDLTRVKRGTESPIMYAMRFIVFELVPSLPLISGLSACKPSVLG